MTTIEVLDVGDFYNHEKEAVIDFGRKAFKLLNDDGVKNMLFERNLLSVISCYGNSLKRAEESADSSGFSSSRTMRSGVSHFVILDSDSNEFLGQARVNDYLNLQVRPKAHKPTFLNRLTGKKITLSPLIYGDSCNIDAWVKPSSNSRNQLAQAYNFLNGETESSWTTEPINSVEGNQAIQLSGLRIVLPPKYYDCEIKNQQLVPLSNLYLSEDIEQEIKTA